MNESLGPQELAAAKRDGRRSRISRIRRSVATGAASAVAAFSGLILIETLTAPDGSNVKETAPATLAEEDVGSGIVSVLLDAVLPGEESSSDSESSLTTGQS